MTRLSDAHVTTPKRPDLQELVTRFGNYSAITAKAWAQWDADMERWKEHVRAGGLHVDMKVRPARRVA
jgi:hypothetical protein